MKNFTTLLCASFLALTVWQASAQISIGSGSVIEQSIPIEPYYGYTYSQVIYFACEIGASGNITGLNYYATPSTSLSNSDSWTVYMANTSKSSFSSDTDWVPVGSLTQVFSGTATISNGVVTITFASPFAYDGASNLLIAVHEDASSYDDDEDDFYCTAVSTDRALTYYNDSNDPDPASPPSADYVLQYIANVQLLGIIPAACSPPSSLTSAVGTTTANLGWTETGTATTWDVEWGPAGFTQGTGTMVTGTTTNPHGLTGLSAGTSYDFYVRADCGVDSSLWTCPYSFSTLCPPFSIPFSENFSSTSSTQDCWTVIDNNSDGDSWDMDGTNTSALAGDENAEFYTDYNEGNNDDYLISPTISLTGNELLRFSYKVQSSSEPQDFQVTLSTTGVAPANFTNVLLPLTAISNTSYTEQVIDLSSYSGDVNIAFHVPAGGLDGYYLYIDSVVVESIPNCYLPLDLTTTGVTSSSANLGWTVLGSTSAWDVEWGAMGFSQGTGATIVGTTTNPHTLSSLTDDTSYDFYVRSNCSPDSSEWVGPYTFATNCNAFTVPFSENFSSTSSTQDCWRVVDNNDDSDAWDMDYSNNPIAGDESAVLNTDNNEGNNDDYLISPEITLTGNELLTFYYRVQSSSEPNDFQVTLSTTGIDPSNFTNVLQPLTAVNNTSYIEKVIDLSSFSGGVNIAFHVPSGGFDGWRLYIDSVVVDSIPSCYLPLDLTATAVDNNSANLGWTAIGSVSAWDVEWGAIGFSQGTGTMVVGTTTNPHALTSLTDNTSYDFYVRSNCSPDSSDWVGPYSFTTDCNAFTVPFSENFSSTSSTQSCWRVIDDNIDGTEWDMDDTDDPLAGDEEASLYTDGYDGFVDDYLISPKITLTGSERLRFSYRVYSSSEPNDFQVTLSTTGTAPASFTNVLQSLIVVSNESYIEKRLDLSSYTGDVNIAFHVPPNGLDGWYIFIDSVVIETDPCPKPDSLLANNIDFTTADLSWTESGSATMWEIEWGVNGFSTGSGTTDTTSSIPASISGLSAAASYDFYVRADCGGGEIGFWSGPYNFSTLPCPPAVSVTSHPSQSTVCIGSSATFNIIASGTALTYQWRKNGVEIAGANSSSYSILGVSMSDSGSYACIVRDPCTSALSNSAVLTVAPTHTRVVNDTLCQGDSILLGGSYQTNVGIYYDVLSSVFGCDSVIATALTVVPSYQVNTKENICQGDSILLYGVYRFSAGTYTDSLQRTNGCDSLRTTILSVEQPITNATSASICTGDSILLAGSYQTSAGIYYDSLSSSMNCDSVVVTTLTVTTVDVSVTNYIDSLEANANSATYQWLDCNNDNHKIQGAIYKVHRTIINGSYAVVVNQNSCIDTSSCYVISTIGLNEYQVFSMFDIYPNPNSGDFIIKVNDKQKISYEILNIVGEQILSGELEIGINTVSIPGSSDGMYFVHLEFGKEERIFKIIVKN